MFREFKKIKRFAQPPFSRVPDRLKQNVRPLVGGREQIVAVGP